LEIEGPHQHHHGHGTGKRWLDMALALSAFVVSIVSLYLGLHSAHTMEKLVASNSYPNIDISVSNFSAKEDKDHISYDLTNTGLGPARIEWINIEVKDKPVVDLVDLIRTCCTKPDEHGKLDAQVASYSPGQLLPKGDSMSVISWPKPIQATPAFERWRDNINIVKVSVCYCSVFDECFIRVQGRERPKSVEACETPKQLFNFGLPSGDAGVKGTFKLIKG
jgi:hypothetical protein